MRASPPPSGGGDANKGIGWFQSCAWIDVKPIKAYKYRLWNNAKPVAGFRRTKTFAVSDCGKDWDPKGEFCHIGVDLGASDGWVEISGVGWFQNGDQIWLPICTTIRYQIWDANKQNVIAGWLDKHVDCSDLVYPPPE